MTVKLIALHQLSFSGPISLKNCLGVLQLAASLRQHQIPVEIPDLEAFYYLFKKDFTLTMEQVMDVIMRPVPRLLGISTMSNNLPLALELAQRVKKHAPETIILLGGPGVSFCAVEILEAFPQIDVIIRGEADDAFPRFIQTLKEDQLPEHCQIKGVVYRENHQIMDNGWPEPVADMDRLPIPAYDLCPSETAQDSDREVVGDYQGISIEAGRGCGFNCTFCSTSHFFKRKHRLKSVDRIIAEIKQTRRHFGNQRIIFNHDILTMHKDYVYRLCHEIRQQLPGLTWKCHARFDTIDAPMLTAMREAGCNEIFMGIETAGAEMQKAINKRLDLSGFQDTLQHMKQLGMRFSLSFIVGLPGETPRDMEAILSHALQARILCGKNAVIKIHTLVPLPGSDLFIQWKEQLAYDLYGSIGTTDLPVGWTAMRQLIQQHPHIFAIYFHIPTGPNGRVQALKYGLIGIAIDSLMDYSLQLAYMVLKERLVSQVVNRIHHIQLPPPATYRDTQYLITLSSLKTVVQEIMDREAPSQWAEKFDTLSRFQLASNRLLSTKGEAPPEFITSRFDPETIIAEMEEGLIRNQAVNAGNDNLDDKRDDSQEMSSFMVFKDREEKKIKFLRLPGAFS